MTTGHKLTGGKTGDLQRKLLETLIKERLMKMPLSQEPMRTKSVGITETSSAHRRGLGREAGMSAIHVTHEPEIPLTMTTAGMIGGTRMTLRVVGATKTGTGTERGVVKGSPTVGSVALMITEVGTTSTDGIIGHTTSTDGIDGGGDGAVKFLNVI